MKFPPAFLDEIRARLPVSEVVGARVKLRKQGREWAGLSPFNAEKTPSFFVNDQKGFFHDFSSGKHGDIFAFLMETEGLSFPEAVERLAAMAGLPMPRSERRRGGAGEEAREPHRSPGAWPRACSRRTCSSRSAPKRAAISPTAASAPPCSSAFRWAIRRPSALPCATRSPPKASASIR